MSELQDRLEYLVNYSSQLIFVSGDSIAQQQRTLEEFLSIQKENTEISYFTSELTMESPDFRRTICRQLLGQKVGSFVRPLKELLKDLHEQPGPFLLCIKQSQTLPNAFLQELWDWVSESKKQSPDHHVNVILFGETAWAEKAKKWLPQRNRNRPVLLSSESIDSSRFDVNALESLMAEERPRFSLNMFQRDEYAPPIVTQKWFIASILALLLVVFLGLMSWQYPAHMKSLLQTGQFPPKAEFSADQLAIINQQLDAKTTQQEEQNIDVLDIDSSSALESSAQQDIQTSAMVNSEDGSPLIASWDEAKKNSDDKIDELKQTIESGDLTLSDEAAVPNEATVAIEAIVPGEATIGLAVAEQNSLETDGDFAVPDIISIEQLDATLGNELLADNTDKSPPFGALPVDTVVYEFDESSILALPEPSVILQISGIQNRDILDQYISDNALQDIVWIYETSRYGGPWYVVLINQRFASVTEAREAAALLPQSVPANTAFAKALTQIKLEIRNR